MTVRVKWREMLLFGMLWAMLGTTAVEGSQEIMKNLTMAFGKTLEICKKELSLSDQVMQDFYSFWKEDHPLTNSELGCALMCIANKLHMVSEDYTVHHQNTHEFAKQNGADDEMAKQLVSLLHNCETTTMGYKDDCTRVLEIAKCFKAKIHELKWAPTMELVEEALIEV